jgi:hypothetical protein
MKLNDETQNNSMFIDDQVKNNTASYSFLPQIKGVPGPDMRVNLPSIAATDHKRSRSMT